MENVLKIHPFLLLAHEVQVHKSSTQATSHFLKVVLANAKKFVLDWLPGSCHLVCSLSSDINTFTAPWG